ncbi:MAG TPA: hypothetical protein VE889_00335 [Actinomycetota bacterium]|jgi:hypothetical protein|nr:hypothetical protein [Actinomycetota bacterium]
MRRYTWIPIVGIVIALVGSACGAGTGPSGGPTGTPGSPTPTRALADGRQFGYISAVDLQGSEDLDAAGALTFDPADWWVGDEANQAAVEDGVIEPGESVPNDYYIRNREKDAVSVDLAEDVELLVVDWPNCCDSIVGDLQRFADSFTTKDPTGAYVGSRSPYWVTVDGGQVVEIEELYLP